MKTLTIATALAAALVASPALAGGKNGLGVGLGLNVATGKSGLVGTLLGGSGKGSQGVAVGAGVNVATGKGGVLGALLGSSSSKSHHGRGGRHGGW